MSWRSQGITGSNNIPLGKTRRFGSESDGNNFDQEARIKADFNDDFSNGPDLKRGRSPDREYRLVPWIFHEAQY